MKVAVVTPTIGSDHLKDCIISVQKQIYDDLTHHIFVDGEEYQSKVLDIIQEQSGLPTKQIRITSLGENVGKGWYGHRVYAACSFLINADIICYLDEDNWIDSNHILQLVRTIEKGNDWAYSLRKIYNKQGELLEYDNCESLGKWPTYFNKDVYHIDTSCFAVKRDIAVRVGHSWYGQWGADRQFFNTLKHYYPKFECSKEYSLCYRLDGNPNSVNEEFFNRGNKMQEIVYKGEYPWVR